MLALYIIGYAVALALASLLVWHLAVRARRLRDDVDIEKEDDL